MYQIARATRDIDHCLNVADACTDMGSRVPGMSYEQGVADAIRWIVGDTDSNPMEDEAFNGVLDDDEEGS